MKGKLKLLKLLYLILKILFIFFTEIGRINFSYTDVVFEEHVKEWFRHGNQRFTREKTLNTSK